MELIVVILVISVLTAAMVPQFQGTFAGTLLHGTARELISTLRLASDQSVTTGQPHRVQIDRSEGRYWLEWIPPDSTEGFFPCTQFNLSARADETAGVIPQSLQVAVQSQQASEGWELFGSTAPEQPGSVSFSPDGRAQPTRIRLYDANDFQIEIVVDPLTSRIRARELDEGGTP